MGLLCKIVLLGATVFIAIIAIKINNCLFEVPPLPVLEDTWWGPGQQTKEDISIKPFHINVPKEILADLKRRLETHRPFTEPLEGIQQQYGINSNTLKDVVHFWKTKYNWREREQYLNKFTQYTTSIQGLQMHYIHVKPVTKSGVRVLPLLLLHGWPGSVCEFYDAIPLLTTPQKGRDYVFEVVVPSFPGYGFSQSAVRPGLGAAQMAVVFKNLMKRLGFEKYYVQGGNWGGFIVSYMATLYPDKVLGMHSNMCPVLAPLGFLKLFLGSLYPPLIVEKEHEHRLYPLSTLMSNAMLETGYIHIHATKPDTIGVALKDSPVGLAAYILEKFTTLTNPSWKEREDGGLTIKYSYETLLDNIMIYWVTGSITTALRIYAETFNAAHSSLELDSIPVLVPSACARFKDDLTYFPDSILNVRYKNLVQISDYPVGGHFAALEEPKLFSEDVWSAVEKFENFNKQSK